MLRIGQAWAGYGPEVIRGGDVLEGASALRPSVTWSSRVIHLKTIEPGAGTQICHNMVLPANRDTCLKMFEWLYAQCQVVPHAAAQQACKAHSNKSMLRYGEGNATCGCDEVCHQELGEELSAALQTMR